VVRIRIGPLPEKMMPAFINALLGKMPEPSLGREQVRPRPTASLSPVNNYF